MRPRRPLPLRALVAAAAALLALASTAAFRQADAPRFDLVIRGGLLLDGTGADGRVADLAVLDGRIAAWGDLSGASARRVVDGSGLVVAPGFIDLHSHADWGFGDPARNLAVNNLAQGIATVVVGQDGRSAWPVGGKARHSFEAWLSQGLAENVAVLVGHGHVRREVMGDEPREPTPEELAQMRALVREAMEDGAIGISTGLSYLPGRFATAEEVIALTREVAPYRGVYISHLRDQSAALVESVRETIRIGRLTGVTVVATHFKISLRENYGRSEDALQVIEEARRSGIAIYTDQYPYTTSSNGVDVRFLSPSPEWLYGNGALLDQIRAATPEELADLILKSGELVPKMYTRTWLLARPRVELERRAASHALSGSKADDAETRRSLAALLDDPRRRELVVGAVTREIERWGGPDTYVIERADDPTLEGLTLAEAAERLGVSPARAAMVLELAGAQMTQFHMSEIDVENILRRDFTATSTDGTVPVFGEGVPHPRSYGSFPRKIRRYVLERKVISLPLAIRSMTGLAADILGWEDRGYLRVGAWADIVLFDPERIRDRATYRDPHRYSEGIELLLVNGVPVWEAGRPTGARPGRVITSRGTLAPARPGGSGGGEEGGQGAER